MDLLEVCGVYIGSSGIYVYVEASHFHVIPGFSMFNPISGRSRKILSLTGTTSNRHSLPGTPGGHILIGESSFIRKVQQTE